MKKIKNASGGSFSDVDFPSYGNFNVRLIVGNGGCADTIQHTIKTVNENPDFNANILSACKIAVIDFIVTNITAANIVSYNWDFGDGSIISTTSSVINHVYGISGTYTVTLTTTDINGCISVVTKNNYIRINGASANFSATNTSGCSGLTPSVTDKSLYFPSHLIILLLVVALFGPSLFNMRSDLGDPDWKNNKGLYQALLDTRAGYLRSDTIRSLAILIAGAGLMYFFHLTSRQALTTNN